MTDRKQRLAALADECDRAQEWMRQPDWAENFSFSDLADWMNERPTHLFPKIAAALRAQSETVA